MCISGERSRLHPNLLNKEHNFEGVDRLQKWKKEDVEEVEEVEVVVVVEEGGEPPGEKNSLTVAQCTSSWRSKSRVNRPSIVSCCFISGREQRHTTNSSAICWRGLNSFIAHPLTLYSYQLKMRVHVR